jgi:Flp pilus assembly protein TadG
MRSHHRVNGTSGKMEEGLRAAPARRFRRPFAGDERGAAAIVFTLSLIPVLGLVGASIDYARASKAQTQLRGAVDAASLAAVKKIGGTYGQRVSAAQGALKANLADAPIDTIHLSVNDITTVDGRGVVVDATGAVPTSFMKLLGITTMNIGAKAEAIAGSVQNSEIALVLDNTGSMMNDMPALKAAATSFVNSVFASGTTSVKMSVVPYVAAVNVGSNFPPAALELTGTAPFQGNVYRTGWVAHMTGCALNPSPAPAVVVPPPPGPPPPVPPPLGSPTGNDRTDLFDGAPKSSDYASLFSGRAAGDFARALFGVSRAAADVTANTIDPIQFYSFPLVPPSYPAGLPVAQIPVGYLLYGCTLQYAGPVSNLELFNRLPGAAWKGCVEARPSPYDVTDDPPNPAVRDTMFVPYFAPDEPDSSPPNKFRNDYLYDKHSSWAATGGAPPGWYNMTTLQNLFKYDGVNVPVIRETPPNTMGPNAHCPDPLLKLTGNKNAILNKINSLSYWAGGGTISSEGLAWGWRTISPNAPFASGAVYGQTKKYIVLMTDGLNSLVENRPGGTPYVLSDYSAYGWLWDTARFTYRSFPHAETMLNTKMQEACTNAKAKGISIFTILFRETDPATVSLLQSCASSPEQALIASDTSSLNAAFESVASQVAVIRLRK